MSDSQTSHALIAADGTLIGTGLFGPGEAPAGAIPCPDGIDLEPGKWFWDASGGCFRPKRTAAPVTPGAGMEAALAGLIRAVVKRQRPPEETLRWLAAWEKSFDAKPSVDGGSGAER